MRCKRHGSTLHRLGGMVNYAEDFTGKAFGSSNASADMDLWKFVEGAKSGVKKQNGQGDCKSGHLHYYAVFESAVATQATS
jgi:hypothetical protein